MRHGRKKALRAMPADVRKGCAFPKDLLNQNEAAPPEVAA